MKDITQTADITRFTVFYGTFIDTPTLGTVRIRQETSVGVCRKDGKIKFIYHHSNDPLKDALDFDQTLKTSEVNVINTFKENGSKFFFPGFIDTHIHASQYPNAGIFGATTLLDWLNRYTFPLESSLVDLKIAKEVYEKVVTRTLSNGTTTAAYYTTIDAKSTKLMANICSKKGQRAFVGKVCMNQNTPDYYKETLIESQISSKEVINYIKHKLMDDKVEPIITPRFAPNCNNELLSWLGNLANSNNLAVQTHLNENLEEIKWVSELFPEAKSYADVYDRCNLLTKKTILAHCIHMTDEEIELLKKRKCGISHCPISNSSITSGECKVRLLLDNGIKIGLGTDLSGGFSSSILISARHALLVSRHLAMKETDIKVNNHVKLSVAEVLHLGTVGGAQVLNLEEKIGSFDVGKQFDAQLIDLESSGTNIDIFSWQYVTQVDTNEHSMHSKFYDLLGKWLFNGDDRNTVSVWVSGKLVHSII